MTLAPLVADQLAEAVKAFRRGAEALRRAAALVRLGPIANLDPEALTTFAAATDANQSGIERMEQLVRRLLPEAAPAHSPADSPGEADA